MTTRKTKTGSEAKAAKELVVMLDALKRDWRTYFYSMGTLRARKVLDDGTVVRFSISRPVAKKRG